MPRFLVALLALVCLLVPSLALAGNADRVSIGHPVTVAAGETLEGDVVVIGADARVDGVVRGDVVVISGTLTLGPDAQVGGDAVHLLGALDQAEAARVGGSTVSVDGGEGAGSVLGRAGSGRGLGDHSTALKVGRVVGWAASSACLVVLGLLFLSTWPERSRNLRRTIEASPGASLLVGGVVSFGLMMLMLLLLFTLVGVIGYPILIPAVAAVWLVGLTGFCEALGDRLPLPTSMRGRAASFVAGALLFSILGLLLLLGGPAAALGVLGLLVVGAMSVGAAVLSGLGGQPYGR